VVLNLKIGVSHFFKKFNSNFQAFDFIQIPKSVVFSFDFHPQVLFQNNQYRVQILELH
jgi:hypothetical protein